MQFEYGEEILHNKFYSDKIFSESNFDPFLKSDTLHLTKLKGEKIIVTHTHTSEKMSNWLFAKKIKKKKIRALML